MLNMTWVALVGAFFLGTVVGRVASISDSAVAMSIVEPVSAPASLAPAKSKGEADADVSPLPEARIEAHEGRVSAYVRNMELSAFLDAIAQAVNIPIKVAEGEVRAVVSTDESWQAGLQDAEPDTRAAAVEKVFALGSLNAEQVVVGALVDEDFTVRERALNSAMSHGVRVPNELVLRLALTDVAPEVRFAALRAFAQLAARDHHAVRVAAQNAVNDSDPSVQSTAYEILAHIDALERTPEDDDFF